MFTFILLDQWLSLTIYFISKKQKAHIHSFHSFHTMRNVLYVAALALVATGAIAATPNSFSAWEAEFPPCIQGCVDSFYNQTIGSSCAPTAKSSTNPSDVACICTKIGTQPQIQALGSQLAACIGSQQCTFGANITAAGASDALGSAIGDMAPLCASALAAKSMSLLLLLKSFDFGNIGLTDFE